MERETRDSGRGWHGSLDVGGVRPLAAVRPVREPWTSRASRWKHLFVPVRLRHVPAVLSVLAVACQVGLLWALWAGGWTITDQEDQRLVWSTRLWQAGCLAALIALILGLAADRRGPSVPIALFALLVALFPTGLLLALRHATVG